MATETTALTTKVVSGSPYQLDRPQTLKASSALLKHIESEAKRKELTSTTQNLLADNDSSSDATSNNEPLWLVVAAKKHIVDKMRLKPGKIPIQHSLNASPTSTICLITADPQRQYKDIIAHPSFPPPLAARITRVIGIGKVKARYKSFESRRQLLSEHDIFLADDRIITRLPEILGKVFYKGIKRPIPIRLSPFTPRKDTSEKRPPPSKSSDVKSIAPPAQCAREIERALSCTHVRISPAATTSIRVGLSSFTPEQVADNVEAVVNGLTEKYITKGWRNIKSIHIKGPNTMAIPIWLADELWVEEKDILEDEEAKRIEERAKQKGKKRKSPDGGDGGRQKKKARKLEDSDFGNEMAERRKKLRQQKEQARGEVDGTAIVQKTRISKEPNGKKMKATTEKAKVVTTPA
ncbi:hypothetical protein MMC24_003102 [Lignoscripta atroalba]|nr:hypothetical protein [Lignoscripta atroalba]